MKFKPDVVLLQETKKAFVDGRMVRSSVGNLLSEWTALPAVGSTGGILVAWNPLMIKVVEVKLGSFSISIKMEDLSLGVLWLFTRVYGPSTPKSRSEF